MVIKVVGRDAEVGTTVPDVRSNSRVIDTKAEIGNITGEIVNVRIITATRETNRRGASGRPFP